MQTLERNTPAQAVFLHWGQMGQLNVSPPMIKNKTIKLILTELSEQ